MEEYISQKLLSLELPPSLAHIPSELYKVSPFDLDMHMRVNKQSHEEIEQICASLGLGYDIVQGNLKKSFEVSKVLQNTNY